MDWQLCFEHPHNAADLIESLSQQLAECQRERDEFMAAHIHAQQINEGLARELYLAKQDAETWKARAEFSYQERNKLEKNSNRYTWLKENCLRAVTISACNIEISDKAIDAARKEPTC
jgi:outer membrane PBP1 activator LpoA protein